MKFLVVLLLLAVVHQIYGVETIQQELVRLTNEYRVQNGLSAIPMSYQLTKVAVIHTLDMSTNNPIGGDCNLHSWSDKGYGLWNGCCYTSNHAFASCMWNKPKEISGGVYNGNGYENAASGRSTAAGALDLWKASSAHNDVILNRNGWADITWRAIGASVCNNYAVLWFSDTADTSSADPGQLTCNSVSLPSPPVAPVSTPVGAPIGTPIAPNTPVSENSPVDQSSPVADVPLDPQGNTPATGTGPSAGNTPSSGPSSANSPSDSINKPSSGHANTAALVGSAVGMAFVALF